MNPSAWSPADIHSAVNNLPRVRLAHLPTPLDEAPRFAQALGGRVRIFIKRDDCTGLLLGGNKTRHNEYILGDAVDSRCDVVVWGAAVQSNNCRQTAAGCARLGLECHLHLSRGSSSLEPQGNLLLDYLVGARIQFTDAKLGLELDAYLAREAAMLAAAGRRPYVWDRARVLPLSTISYVAAMAELAEQIAEPAAIYVCSAGSTGSGLAMGKKLLGWRCPLRLISPMHWPWSIPDDMAAQANLAAGKLGVPHRLIATEIDCDLDYVAPGYGMPSPEGREALELLAKSEGILTDPVYTAKALAALISDVRANRYPEGSSIVFIHTGGVPAIFAEPTSVLAI